MTVGTSPFASLIDNEALRVLDIRLPDGAAGPIKVSYDNAVLVGMDDGAGHVVADSGGSSRFLPIARGRTDWLGRGQLEVHGGPRPFGRAVLVEIRTLPDPRGVARTFGDRVIVTRDDACVYEEIIGPAQVRTMHNHGPRLVVCLTDIELRNTLPGGEKVEVKRGAGAVTWNGAVVTHEVMNVAPAPFWCVCVEHP